MPACTQVEMLVSRACEPISGSILCTGDEIGFYLCLLFRVSPTNKRTSDLIYPTDPSRICVELVIELLHLGCVARNSRSSLSSDRGSSWPRVEELSRVWIAPLIVSRSLYINIIGTVGV